MTRMSGVTVFTVLTILTLLSLSQVVQGLQGSVDAHLDNAYTVLTEFGFLDGGSQTWTAELTGPPASFQPVSAVFFSCKLDDCNGLPSTPASLCSVAGLDAHRENMLDVAVLGNGNGTDSAPTVTVTDKPITSSNTVLYVGVGCGNKAQPFRLDYHFLNPGGEELSAGEIPLKVLPLVFACVWGLVWVLHTFNSIRQRQLANPLHRLLGLLPVTLAVNAVVSLMFWRGLSESGVVHATYLAYAIMLQGLCGALTFLMVMLLAKGWWITRRSLPAVEHRAVMVLTWLYFFAYYAWQAYGGLLMFFFLGIVYIMVVRVALTGVAVNMHYLLTRLHFMPMATLDDSSVAIARQLVTMRRLRSWLVGYLTLDIMFSIWSIMALQRLPWTSYLFDELCRLCFLTFLLVTFRLRTNSPFYSAANAGTGNAPLLAGGAMEVMYPTMPATPLAPTPVVIVRNPGDDSDSPSGGGIIPTNVMFGTPSVRPPDDSDRARFLAPPSQQQQQQQQQQEGEEEVGGDEEVGRVMMSSSIAVPMAAPDQGTAGSSSHLSPVLEDIVVTVGPGTGSGGGVGGGGGGGGDLAEEDGDGDDETQSLLRRGGPHV